MLKEIKELSDHMLWADSIVWDAVFKLPADDKTKKLKELLFHIHSVQHAYLAIWQKMPFKFKKESEFNNLNEIAEWGSDFHNKYRIYLNDINENVLYDIITIPWTKSLEKYLGKTAEPSTLIQQIFQVTLHSTYHRGQVNKALREAGGEPPLTDFIYWVWIGKPEGRLL